MHIVTALGNNHFWLAVLIAAIAMVLLLLGSKLSYGGSLNRRRYAGLVLVSGTIFAMASALSLMLRYPFADGVIIAVGILLLT